jgi:hypothetical protein
MIKLKSITISLLYYNDEEHISRHVKKWEEYNDLVKFQVIDDGSSIPAKNFLKETSFPELDSSLYRIEEDIPWNIPGARNLSATVCDTPFVLICDMDQIFDRKAVEKMLALTTLNGGNWFYSFRRFSEDKSLKSKCGRKTCGTMLLSIKDWWAVGGYDEDMSGSYGHNDPLFRRQLKKVGLKEVTPEIYCEEISADCKLNRRSRNRRKYHEKIKELPRQNWNCLRFNWKHESF